MFLIYILIVLFSLLLINNCVDMWSSSFNIIEGLNETVSPSADEYQPYNLDNPNNALILGQQNAGNIQVLRGEVDGLKGIERRVTDAEGNIDALQRQLDDLASQQADYAQELVGDTQYKFRVW